MAIRSRILSSASAPVASAQPHALAALLSTSSWPGLRPWLASILCGTGIFALLAGLAWHGASGRLPDMGVLLVAIPCGTLLIVLLVAALWTFFARIPFEAGLSFLARFLPIAWIFPLADLLRSGGSGLVVPAVPFDATGIFLASFTAGLLPAASPIPIGLRVGITAAVLVTAFLVWFVRPPNGTDLPKAVGRAVLAGLCVSLVLVKFTFFPSALGVFGSLAGGRGWMTDAADTSRETIRAVTNGYWWNNLYDRFPSAVESQADIAIRLTSAGAVTLALGVLLALLFFWRVSAGKRLLRHALVSWSALDLALYVIGAAVITSFATKVPEQIGTWWYALPLAFLALVAFRLHAVLERCLHHAATGAADGRDPLACGDVSAPVAADLSLVAILFALVAAFALGWTVFVPLVIALAASFLSRDRAWTSWPWVATAFRGMGAAMLALAGSFFMTQHARLGLVPLVVMVLAAGHRVAMEVFWSRRR